MDAFPLSAPVRARLEHAGREFLAAFLAAACERDPDNLQALAELGNVLTQLGRVEEGLAVDERLVQRAPDDPTVRYNLACSLALLGRTEEALDALETAVELGYDDPEFLSEDQDLAALQGELRFEELLRRLRTRSQP